MTDRELDVAIAEKVMGWTRQENWTGYPEWRDANAKPYPIIHAWEWSPSSDRNATALVLERIREMKLAEKLVNALSPTLPRTNSYSMQVWTHMVATPRQLMEAALAAVKEKV